ncbi:MAG TPA: hypothetical protein DHW86_07225, partial [Rhodobiaceae bacterium]|nr:hypothetical protein [Rhodobiaceae bacterium]
MFASQFSWPESNALCQKRNSAGQEKFALPVELRHNNANLREMMMLDDTKGDGQEQAGFHAMIDGTQEDY